MIYFRTNDDNKVSYIHYQPFDTKNGLNKSEAELVETGFLVEEFPKAEKIDNKSAHLYYTVEGGFTIEYTDNPLTDRQKMDRLQNDIDYLILKQEGLI